MRKNVIVGVVLVFVVLLLSAFMIKPAIQGYSVYQQLEKSSYDLDTYGINVKNLEVELAKTQANLSVQSNYCVTMSSELKETVESLSRCERMRAASEAQVAGLQEQLQIEEKLCEDQLDYLRGRVVEAEDTREEEIDGAVRLCESALGEKEEEYELLLEELEMFVANMAKSVCCKQRVDNSAIEFYEIVSGRLVCLEQGERELSC